MPPQQPPPTAKNLQTPPRNHAAAVRARSRSPPGSQFTFHNLPSKKPPPPLPPPPQMTPSSFLKPRPTFQQRTAPPQHQQRKQQNNQPSTPRPAATFRSRSPIGSQFSEKVSASAAATTNAAAGGAAVRGEGSRRRVLEVRGGDGDGDESRTLEGGARRGEIVGLRRRVFARMESIEDSSQGTEMEGDREGEEEEEEEEDLGVERGGRRGKEDEPVGKEDGDGHEDEEMLFENTHVSKRRRVSGSPELPLRRMETSAVAERMAPPLPSLDLHTPIRTPPARIAHITPIAAPTSAHGFRIGPRASFAGSSAASPTVLGDSVKSARPVFLKPEPAPAESAAPLPDAFSPHRRGQKYVSGGLAETMRSWIVEVGQSIQVGMPSRRRAGSVREQQQYQQSQQQHHEAAIEQSFEGMLLKVTEARYDEKGKFILVTGYIEHSTYKVLLIRKSAVKEKAENVRRGDVVMLSRPCWDLDVEGEEKRWVVAAEWKVLRTG